MTSGTPLCKPLDDGCKALEKVRGELRNEKASKKYVDERFGKMEKKIDRIYTAMMAFVVTFSVTAIFTVARFALSLLRAGGS